MVVACCVVFVFGCMLCVGRCLLFVVCSVCVRCVLCVCCYLSFVLRSVLVG